MIHSETIKKKFLDFFTSKDHAVLPNYSLIPENDPSTLFIIAGVHPIAQNILDGEHPLGNRLVGIQRCFRTIDIEETGDRTHLTLLEMIGNWSLGDYFKKEALEWSMEFLVEQLDLDINRLYATVFAGDNKTPPDEESVTIWKAIYKKYGIDAEVYDPKKKINDNARIFPSGRADNFWGPAGQTGPCGPSSEIFYYRESKKPDFERSRPNVNDHEYMEIWNNVFMEYTKDEKGTFSKLKSKNVDTGMGFERLCALIQNRQNDGSVTSGISVYDTDLFDEPKAYLRSLIEDETKESTRDENPKAREISEFDYTLTELEDIEQSVEAFRIILDHVRACTFLIGDGVEPSNKDQGYILRRHIRRTIRFSRLLGIEVNFLRDMAQLYIEKYKLQYPNLAERQRQIIDILEKEEVSFEKVIRTGRKELDKITGSGNEITGELLFTIYETHGFPLEIALDHLGIFQTAMRKELEDKFKQSKNKHQELSRKGAEKKFKGGLADHSDITKRYHTATHLLLRALQIVLGNHVHQRGSNITQERLRFDFSHPEKVTKQQLQKVEDIVNDTISRGLKVVKKDMPKEEAVKIGAEHEFDKNYPDKVSVYFIQTEDGKDVFSKEFCGGPHVESLNELAEAGEFKIIKEESSGAGIRRIKAVLQKK